MKTNIKRKVAAATFKIQAGEGGHGQCVLVEGNWLLTAAHCVEFYTSGGMALGDDVHSKITARRRSFGVSVHEVLPVSDLAILTTADPQSLSEWAEEFERLCETVEPLRIRRTIPRESSLPIWVRTHRKSWVTGIASYLHGRLVWIKTDSPIEGGTSGGPIVDENGDLVSLVSWSGGILDQDGHEGASPFVAINLPPWATATMRTKGRRR